LIFLTHHRKGTAAIVDNSEWTRFSRIFFHFIRFLFFCYWMFLYWRKNVNYLILFLSLLKRDELSLKYVNYDQLTVTNNNPTIKSCLCRSESEKITKRKFLIFFFFGFVINFNFCCKGKITKPCEKVSRSFLSLQKGQKFVLLKWAKRF
jgi:hypothetical protein